MWRESHNSSCVQAVDPIGVVDAPRARACPDRRDGPGRTCWHLV
jgi:hypothetical protein